MSEMESQLEECGVCHSLHPMEELGAFDDTGVSAPDKTYLEYVYNTVKSAKSKDYTPETWADFAEALANAEAVLADENADQTTIDNAMTDLLAAYQDLQLAEVVLQKIFHLDSGRTFYSKDWAIALLNELSAAGYTHLQLAFGNDGFRFVLDKYAKYFSENGSWYFHIGADEYGNDAYSGSMGFPSMGSALYAKFADFVNANAAIFEGYGMTATFAADTLEDAIKAAEEAQAAAEEAVAAAEANDLAAAEAAAEHAQEVAELYQEIAAMKAQMAEYLKEAQESAEAAEEYRKAAEAAELAYAKYYALIRLAQYADNKDFTEAQDAEADAIVDEYNQIIKNAKSVAAVEEALAAALAAIDAIGAVSELPFVDVPVDSFYYDSVKWAVDNGITTGTTETTFSPDKVVTRAEAVTFLWRAEGEPETNGTNSFADVVAGAWYEAPINWAVENGITNGLSTTEFGINAGCNRAQMVTFLYRAYN